jgi:hypothetical protein
MQAGSLDWFLWCVVDALNNFRHMTFAIRTCQLWSKAHWVLVHDGYKALDRADVDFDIDRP